MLLGFSGDLPFCLLWLTRHASHVVSVGRSTPREDCQDLSGGPSKDQHARAHLERLGRARRRSALDLCTLHTFACDSYTCVYDFYPAFIFYAPASYPSHLLLCRLRSRRLGKSKSFWALLRKGLSKVKFCPTTHTVIYYWLIVEVCLPGGKYGNSISESAQFFKR